MTVSKAKKLDVVVAGHLCLDMFPGFISTTGTSVADLFRPGRLVRTREMTFAAAGSVANTGLALRKFGCEVAYVARVGDDAVGRMTIDMFGRQANTDGIRCALDEASSYTVVLAPPGIDRIFLHYPGTNDTFSSADVDFSIVEESAIFHFGYPALMAQTREAGGADLASMFKQAKACGATTSMDNSLPDPDSEAGKADWSRIYSATLPFVDIFTPSIEEAFLTVDRAAYLRHCREYPDTDIIDSLPLGVYRDISARLIAFGSAIVAIKAGHLGWYLRTASRDRLAATGRTKVNDVAEWADRELWCPSFTAEHIVSATGAGDSSIAGFLAGLLRELPLNMAMKMANCAGRMNLAAMDAVNGLGTWSDMEDSLPNLSVRELPFLRREGWTWHDGLGCWTPD